MGAAQKAVETPPAASYREKYTNMMKRAQENLDAGAQSAGSSRSYGLGKAGILHLKLLIIGPFVSLMLTEDT